MKFFSPLVVLSSVLSLGFAAAVADPRVAALRKELRTIEIQLEAFDSAIKLVQVHAAATESELNKIFDTLDVLGNSLQIAGANAVPLQFPRAYGQTSVLLAPLLNIGTKSQRVLGDLVKRKPAFAQAHNGILFIYNHIIIFQDRLRPFVDSVGRAFDEVTGRGDIYHLELRLEDVFDKALAEFRVRSE